VNGRALGTVVCPQPEAADTAVDILEAGGNAVDAAVACALVQGVVDPLMCGIAGFGSLALYRPREGTRYLDFHAPAPLAAREDMWADRLEGETRDGFGFLLRDRVNDLGYQAICVPMALAAYEEAHRRWGRLPWSDVVAPAVAWAREGYVVRPAMMTFFLEGAAMGRAATLDRLACSATGRTLYLTPDGRPKPVGASIVNPDLAATLDAIAREGAATFYRGAIAERILADMATSGGLLTGADLAAAAPVDAEPLVGSYRGLRIVTNRPPGGGVMLLMMLNILENFDLRATGHNTAQTIRVVAEAMKRATIDKDRHVGDPEFVDVPLDWLLDKARAADAAAAIRRGERAEVPRIREAPPPRHTTHISLIDADGTAVAMTHSLGMPSGVITDGLGFMYNGCMGCSTRGRGAPGRSRRASAGSARWRRHWCSMARISPSCSAHPAALRS